MMFVFVLCYVWVRMQLGDGTSSDWYTPPSSDVLTGVAMVSVGANSTTCVLMLSGGVRCWGNNQYGQVRTHTVDVFVRAVMLARLCCM